MTTHPAIGLTTRRVVGALALVVAATTLLSGCGGGGAVSTSSTSGPGSTSPASTTAPNGPASTTSTTAIPPMAPTAPPDTNSPDASQAAWLTLPSANTKAGALIVDTHADYQCPFCKEAEVRYAPLLEELSDRGDIVWRVHFRSFLDQMLRNDSSTRSVIAATCVDVADRTKFAAYNNAIFANQPQEGRGFTDQQLMVDFTAAAGLTGDALTTFKSCFTSQATLAWVQAVEKNNQSNKTNANPPNKYLFGGNDQLCYANNKRAKCTDAGAVSAGVLSTPSFFAGGVEFGLGDLVNDDWSMKYKTADDLLTFLKGVAAG